MEGRQNRTAGVTGHRSLPSDVRQRVRAEVRRILDVERVDTGYSSLAPGADQIFAELILSRGASLVSVQPFATYADTLAGTDRSAYVALRRRASRVIELPFVEPSDEAFLAAGRRVVDEADLLIAVWDGRPAGGLGGTGDVVGYARERNTRVAVVWPPGSRRL